MTRLAILGVLIGAVVALVSLALASPWTDSQTASGTITAACGFTASDDFDGDGLDLATEEGIGTDPCNPDTDQDGCSDGVEAVGTPGPGGAPNPLNFWDFFDTPDPLAVAGPPNYQRDKAITIGDIFAVAGRFGATGTATTVDDALAAAPASGYHAGYDRSNVEAKLSGPADGAVTIGDVFSVAGQFGRNCA